MAFYDKPDSPGCQVGVIRDGKFLFKRAFGSANLEYRIPLTTQSITYVASVSKQFTGMSILLLDQAGKLMLDGLKFRRSGGWSPRRGS